MNDILIFAFGVFVTLIVGAAVTLLMIGASNEPKTESKAGGLTNSDDKASSPSALRTTG